MKYFILLLFFASFCKSSTTPVPPPELTQNLFYELIVADRCLERRSEISLDLIKEPFDFPTDPTGFNRYPLHVAIDNQSNECFKIIMNVIYKSGERHRIYLIQMDNRGLTAVEHALKNWQHVAFQALPESTYTIVLPGSIFTLDDEVTTMKLIKTAMENNLLANQFFLRSLFSKMPNNHYKTFVFKSILETFLELEDCDSDVPRMFFGQIIQFLQHPFVPELAVDEDYFYNFHIKAIRRQCICFLESPLMHQFVSGTAGMLLAEASDKPFAFKAISDARVKLLKSTDGGDADDKIDEWYDDLKKYYRTVFPILGYKQNELSDIVHDYDIIRTADSNGLPVSLSDLKLGLDVAQIKTLIDGIDFEHMLKAFFDLNFIPDTDLRKEIEDGTLRADLLLYGCVPSVLLLALHRPDVVVNLNKLAGGATAIDLISCYAPNAFPLQLMTLKEDLKSSALKFVISKECKSSDEVKKESIRLLCKTSKKPKVIETFVVRETSWNLFSKLFYETSEADMLEVVNLVLQANNFDLAYKATMTRKLPLNYATLTNFLVVGKIHFVIDLMDLAIDPTDINDVKVFHDRFINLFYHEEDRLLMIVLQRIWTIAGFNINEEVDCSRMAIGLTIPKMSLFKLFLNLGKYDLLTRLIKLFPDELRVTESDKDYAVSRSSEGKEQKLFSDYAVDNYNKPF